MKISTEEKTIINNLDIKSEFQSINYGREVLNNHPVFENQPFLLANIVQLHSGKYILSSHPNFIEDSQYLFWNIIWQYNSPLVVCLDSEHPYLPEANQTQNISPNLKIENLGETLNTHWTMRSISLTNEKGESFITKHLTCNWPDFGTPDPEALQEYLECIQAYKGSKEEPITIHCLSGQGRTGTLAAILEVENQQCSPKQAVSTIRQQRPNKRMVETVTQYELIHQVYNNVFFN